MGRALEPRRADETTRRHDCGPRANNSARPSGRSANLDDPAQITAAAEVLAEARKKIYRMLAE